MILEGEMQGRPAMRYLYLEAAPASGEGSCLAASGRSELLQPFRPPGQPRRAQAGCATLSAWLSIFSYRHSAHYRSIPAFQCDLPSCLGVDVLQWYVAGDEEGAPRLTRNQVRLVTDDDIGLKVLREAPAEAAQAIECVRSCLA